MKWKPLILAVMCAWSSSAFAGLDPDRDSMGLYFDPNGNQNALTRQTPCTIATYLVLMNPLGSTDAFECTVTRTGATSYLFSTTYPVPVIDVDSTERGFAVGAVSPFPAVGNAVVLCVMNIIISSSGPLEFRLGPATIPTLPGGRPVVGGPLGGGNSGVRLCGVASGDVRYPVAVVNGGAPVGAETATFGDVKSLFR